MEIIRQLRKTGLSNSEIRVYLYLLEQGLSTPPQVAKGTKMARTNCYNVLRGLRNRGLISTRKSGKRLAFLANDPNALLRAIEQRKERLEMIIPDLRALYTTAKNKPTIHFYDGFEQVKYIFSQTLATKEIMAIASTNQLYSLDPVFFTKYQRQLQQKGIVFHDVLTYESSKQGAKQAKDILKGLYDVRVLPKKYDDVPMDILIWDDSIALISYSEPIFGTVITNKLLVKAFKLIFKVIWHGDKCTQFTKYHM